MIVLDKLEDALLAHFGGGEKAISIAVEPTNAMARREIRVMPTGSRLAPADATGPLVDYMPYEFVQDIVISIRLSGGNTSKLLTGQAMFHSAALNEFLTQRLVVLHGVDEVLPDMRATVTPGWELKIVGDAELTSAKRLNSGFSGSQEGTEFEQKKDDPFVWREDWQASLVMTVHRVFPNPHITTLVFEPDGPGEEIVVGGKIPKE